MFEFDVVVVGAGPAGSAAAIAAARAGNTVALLERGPFPGSKNMYGGVVYGRVLDGIIPNWWEEAPIQRWVTRRGTMLMTPTQALTIDFQTESWATPPYNGATALRPEFDSWLAQHAVTAGAELICSTTAVGLIRDETQSHRPIIGVRTDRADGDIMAKVVIACDGSNSFLAKEAGLYDNHSAEHFTVGVKETLALPKEVIDQRFGLRGNEGADFEIVGCTGNIPGGGFLYTNLDTISLGVVLKTTELAKGDKRPEELIADLKAHRSIAPFVEGAEVKEYSAHVIPEGGFNEMPELICDGMIVAGDAAAMCLAAGIWLEGVNFAIGAGWAGGQAAAEAIRTGDTSSTGLSSYTKRIESNFVLSDHRKLADIPELVLSERVQQRYPQIACNTVERMFQVQNPRPKPGLSAIARAELKAAGVRLRDVAKDGWTGLRGFG